jgi:hypothetical protein
MVGDVEVLKHLSATILVILALELHLLKLFFHLFFDGYELWILALHRTHAGFVVKFL